MFGILPYFLYANIILSLASIANTSAFGLDENNFALFPTPVPASKILVRVYKNIFRLEIVFQPNLSKNHLFCTLNHL